MSTLGMSMAEKASLFEADWVASLVMIAIFFGAYVIYKIASAK